VEDGMGLSPPQTKAICGPSEDGPMPPAIEIGDMKKRAGRVVGLKV
jgi:hypothetical protein